MLGTFAGALEARHIDASNGRLTGEITDASGCAGRSEGYGGTRSRDVPDALSIVSNFSPNAPTYLFLHVGTASGVIWLLSRQLEVAG